ALIHQLSWSMVRMDQYMATPFDEVIDARVLTSDDNFVPRVLRDRGEHPVPLTLPLNDHRSILHALKQLFPLVVIIERRGDARYVGQIESAGEGSVTLNGVSTAAEWTGTHTHAYGDITAIEFSGAYLEALAQTVHSDV